MAFRSLAQMEKFKQLVNEGKMSQQVFNEWSKGTTVENLPKRIGSNSPKNAEHVQPEHRTVRKKRTQRKHRTIPTQAKKRTRPKPRSKPKQRKTRA